MATIGAGTTGGFYGTGARRSSSTDSKHRIGFGSFSNVRYQAIFSKAAFKQGLQEQKLREHEYLSTRRRARRKREEMEKADEYKRRASVMQPYGILLVLTGLVLSTCGFVDEWAKTFPLGDISEAAVSLRVGGLTTLMLGIALLSASHLIYYYNETGTICNPTMKHRVISVEEARKRIPRKSGLEKWIYYLSLLFRMAVVLLVTGMLGFCTGYIAEWGITFPGGGLSDNSKRTIGKIGLWSMITAVTVLIVTDTLVAWLESNNKLDKQTKLQIVASYFPTSHTIPTLMSPDPEEGTEQRACPAEPTWEKTEEYTNDSMLNNLQSQLRQARPLPDANCFDMPHSESNN